MIQEKEGKEEKDEKKCDDAIDLHSLKNIDLTFFTK